MAGPKGSEPTALRRRVPLAARSVVERLRRRPASPAIRPWTATMTAIALAALAASIAVALLVDPHAVDFVREHRRSPLVRWPASVTDLGKSEWYLVPAGLAVIALALDDWKARLPRALARRAYVFGQSAFAFAAVALSGILVNVVKLLVGRVRPVLHDDLGPLAFRPLQFDYQFLSYPSGHATTAGAVALVLMLLVPRLRWLVLALAVVVAFSRVAALAHYPGDVIAGFAFGFLFSLWLARWLAARGVVFRVVGDRLLPVPRHGLAWKTFLRKQ